LGASNDGSEGQNYCSPQANFVVSAFRPRFEDPEKKRRMSPWMFSGCSENSFKRALVNKYVQFVPIYTLLQTTFVYSVISSEWEPPAMEELNFSY
ncbi:hypothetical protein ACJMK2_001299, partial [Sinanodonta woodiana]